MDELAPSLSSLPCAAPMELANRRESGQKAVQPWERGREARVLKNVNTWDASIEEK